MIFVLRGFGIPGGRTPPSCEWSIAFPICIVFTDAYTSAWVPSAKLFFTCILTFDDEAGKTRYTARARHWTAENCAAHEKMGFHEGWGVATDQLTALARTL